LPRGKQNQEREKRKHEQRGGALHRQRTLCIEAAISEVNLDLGPESILPDWQYLMLTGQDVSYEMSAAPRRRRGAADFSA
jgi:hypothetical protein